MKSTVFPAIAIVLGASALGLGYNVVRSKDSIGIRKNYFQTLNLPAQAEEPAKNPFPVVTLDEMIDFYQSAEFGTGETVFVDARDDDHYAEAHIPGALHVDRYNSDIGFEEVQTAIEQAELIVVYCGGGECEDSILLATEFVMERDVPLRKVRVFEGGMEAWEGDNLETEEGAWESDESVSEEGAWDE